MIRIAPGMLTANTARAIETALNGLLQRSPPGAAPVRPAFDDPSFNLAFWAQVTETDGVEPPLHAWMEVTLTADGWVEKEGGRSGEVDNWPLKDANGGFLQVGSVHLIRRGYYDSNLDWVYLTTLGGPSLVIVRTTSGTPEGPFYPGLLQEEGSTNEEDIDDLLTDIEGQVSVRGVNDEELTGDTRYEGILKQPDQMETEDGEGLELEEGGSLDLGYPLVIVDDQSGSGSDLNVNDGSTTINPTTTLSIGSGITLTNPASGEAHLVGSGSLTKGTVLYSQTSCTAGVDTTIAHYVIVTAGTYLFVGNVSNGVFANDDAVHVEIIKSPSTIIGHVFPCIGGGSYASAFSVSISTIVTLLAGDDIILRVYPTGVSGTTVVAGEFSWCRLV